nr:sigma-54 dependent transcriptional regulator [Sphingomonas jatrophae]
MPQRTLLLIDDEPAQARLVAAIAARGGWRTVRASGLAEAWGAADAEPPQAVLLDHPGSEAHAAVAEIRARLPAVPVIVLTLQGGVAQAVAAMRAGAADFLVKPIAADRLLAALDAAAARSFRGELRPLAEKMPAALGFDEIVGTAPAFRAALDVAANAARARVAVLIEGESGVGKEMVAQAIHAASPRANRPMVVVTCATLPHNLAASELFGHERGAFTGAFDRRQGRFAEADGGTLFLDDVGALPADAQIGLLHVLQSGEVQPVGARARQAVDVRVIAATSRDLAAEVAAGQFREDLFYRLGAVRLNVPPLRQRPGDIVALARHLLRRIERQPGLRPLGITESALALLEGYGWPGNVRQLYSVLFRAAVLCEGNALTPADFPQIAAESLAQGDPAAAGGAATAVPLYEPNGHLRSLDAIEADVIRLAIGHYRGRMSEVARRLGIGRSTLYRRLGELGIDSAA